MYPLGLRPPGPGAPGSAQPRGADTRAARAGAPRPGHRGHGLLTRDVSAAAERLGDAIEKGTANTGYDRIHVIGHSLSGLIPRYYVQRHGGGAPVHTLVP